MLILFQTQGKQNKPKKDKGGEKAGQISELQPLPSFIESRDELWKKLKAHYEADLAAKTTEAIQVTLPDGKVVAAESWRTSPYDLARGIR